MAKHRAISQHSLKGRTVIAGVLASGALMVAAPAAIALADSGNGTNGANPAFAMRAPARPDARRDAAFGRILESSAVGKLIVGELSQSPQGEKVLNRLGLGRARLAAD